MTTADLSGDPDRTSWKDQQRAWLIKSTVELLSTTSINDLSVAQIARHAGVSRPLFYTYFESKYDVLAGALAGVWEELDDGAREMTRAQADDGDLVAIVRSYLTDSFEVWNRHLPLLQALVQARDADPAIGDLWEKMIQRRSDGALLMAERMRDEGRIAPITDDLPSLMEALQGMANWALMDRARNQTRTSHDRLVETHTRLWLHAFWGRDSDRVPDRLAQ